MNKDITDTVESHTDQNNEASIRANSKSGLEVLKTTTKDFYPPEISS